MTIFKRRLSSIELAFIARNISLMLKAGIPLGDAITFVKRQTKATTTQNTLDALQRDVQAGIKFSKALETHETTFGTLFTEFARIGEEGGNLEETLLYLASQYEREEDTKKKIRAALIYPVIILTIVVAYALVFAFIIFPRLQSLFADFKTELPLLTRIVIYVSDWLRSWGFILILGVMALAILLVFLRRVPGIAQTLDRLSVTTPGIKHVVCEFLFARFFHILAYLTKSGIPLLDALKTAQDASPNTVLKKHIAQIKKRVEEGKTLTEGMEETNFFPQLSLNLIATAEKSGSLESSLDYLGSFYDRNIDYTTKNISASIEPLLLIFVGIAVALLAIAIILPIYQFTGAISFL